ncbi:MAG: DUF2273 domain-containing protein [Lachnospiraceae bacterium]|jgi:uncharacterized membrane protein|nr:DUF2273 domain-containing protein [Lachnospiraceae bacterium]
MKEFVMEYKGAIIGAVIALLIIITGLDRLIFGAVVVVIGMFVGNFVQRNKEEVKEKLKKFIDRM